MEKILCLPKISIKDLQNKVKQRRTTHKKYNYEQQFTDNGRNHHHQIKITSPFYQKCIHKQKCQCQYHRFKKVVLSNKSPIKKRQQSFNQFIIKSGNHPLIPQKQMKLHIDNRPSRVQFQSPPKILQPLQNINENKHQIENESQIIDIQNNTSITSKSIQRVPTKKTLKNIKYKPISEILNEETNAKIETLNYEYIALVSKRLSNEKFKQKYLKTLFGFIKMKYNQDKSYMYNSKAYIQNSLNMLLNHFSMDKITDVDHLSQEQILQIAYYMNCLPDKVKGIILDLGRAVSQMQRVLAGIRQNRKLDMQQQQNNKESRMNQSFLINYQKQEEQNHLKQQSLSNLYTNYPNSSNIEQTEGMIECPTLQTKQSIFVEVDQNNESFPMNQSLNLNNLSRDRDQYTELDIHKDKHSSIRSSSRRVNDLLSNSTSKKSILQKSIIKDKQNQQSSSNIRKSILKSHKNQQILNRSVRSTVLGIVDETQKQTHFSKKKHTSKLKKTRLKSKYVDQFDQKYGSINYDKYITKKNFQDLISDIERLNQNDMERGQTIYNILGVERFLDDHQKIEDIIKIFQPIFNEKSLHFFLRHIMMVRDKRYIQKLERQLDDMLQQVKKNDPRSQSLDFFEVKAEKKMPSCMSKMAKCRQLKIEKKEPINHIKYFQAQQQVQRHKIKQQSVKLNLEQVQLGGINFQSINPTYSLVVKHTHSPPKDMNCSRRTNLPDISNQKKILQYMKKNHEGTFNYLNQQITNVCRSLSKQPL